MENKFNLEKFKNNGRLEDYKRQKEGISLTNLDGSFLGNIETFDERDQMIDDIEWQAYKDLRGEIAYGIKDGAIYVK